MAPQHNKKKICYLGCIVLLLIISVVTIFNAKLYIYMKISALDKQRLGERIECALQHEDDPAKVNCIL